MKKEVLTALFLIPLASSPALALEATSSNPYYSLYPSYYYQQYPRRQPAPYSYFNYYYYYYHRYGQEKQDGSTYHYLYYYSLEKKSPRPSWLDSLASWLGAKKK
ncbi:MAG TPA: hypothetical protein V6C82_04080 [Chroococcales cyanobacterium]|jgi:hypothetical protein